jgi:oligopeptide/dipeptide ABC transporter ATP-binding protein
VTYLYITHDLSTVRSFCRTVAVMYSSRIVEFGTAEDIFTNYLHPYSKALILSTPVPNPSRRESFYSYEVPDSFEHSPDTPSSGCAYRKRCALALDVCAKRTPDLVKVSETHCVACWAIDC